MNKDEMMTIEEMEKIINEHDNYSASKCDMLVANANKDEMIKEIANVLDSLYNAGYRKVADDEIVIKKSEYEALLLEQKRLKEMVDRIPCGYELKEVTRQETAREIAKIIISNRVKIFNTIYSDFAFSNMIYAILKENGIELEGKL